MSTFFLDDVGLGESGPARRHRGRDRRNVRHRATPAPAQISTCTNSCSST